MVSSQAFGGVKLQHALHLGHAVCVGAQAHDLAGGGAQGAQGAEEGDDDCREEGGREVEMCWRCGRILVEQAGE